MVSSRTRVSQNQAKSNYKDCSFGNRHSFVKGTRLIVLIFAKSQAGVLADLDPPKFGLPGPNSLADLDPPVQIR